MPRSWTRAAGLSLFLLLAAMVIIAAFVGEYRATLDFSSADYWLGNLAVFDRFFLDFLLVCLIGILLVNGRWPLRCLAYVWCGLFFLSYLVQYLAVYMGGEFATFLAVDNANHISLLINRRSLSAGVGFIVVAGLFVWLVEFRCKRPAGFLSGWILPAGVFLGAVLVHQSDKWLSDQSLAIQTDFYSSKGTRLAHKSPMESLYKVLFREKSDALKPLDQNDTDRAAEYGIAIKLDQRFPLIKPALYSSPLPFSASKKIEPKPNVIVFFAEGISARTLDIYDGLAPSLTPNLTDFASSSMVVNNYFNHTYATYRGLQGQLCSFYPTHGGHGGWDTHYDDLKTINYLCLSNLVNELGYETVFLDTHRADFGFVDEMMLQLGFQTVINAEEVVEKHIGGEPLRRDALSDNQLMEGLVGILREKEISANSSSPFFLGLYNLETHTFQKIRKDGKKYREGDNYVLNTIHNFDHAFGKFWNYFQNSTFFDNTIVVFTSDHAHYPDRDYRKTVNNMLGGTDNYQPYFVDRIPLVIYDPFRNLPSYFDAKFASSIDFAPSMAHWLGIENQANSFIGNSIFDENRVNGLSIASADIEHYRITKQGIEASTKQDDDSKELKFIDYLLGSLREVERHDRIWPSD